MSERIVIFGYEGRWGKVLDRGAQSLGHKTRGIEKDSTLQDRIDAVRWATVLAFATWPDILIEQIALLEDEITEEKITFDICGKKGPIIPTLHRLDQKGTSYCSSHPEVNEKTPLKGAKVMVMPVGPSSEPATTFVKGFFSSLKMIPIEFDLGKHDQEMGPEQGLPHGANRAVGFALQEEGLDPQAMWDLAPGNAELHQISLWRTINQPSRISAQAVVSFLRTGRGRRMYEKVAGNLWRQYQIVEQNPNDLVAEEKLTAMFEQDTANLQQHPIAKQMQKWTTTIIERLANLRLQSITIFSSLDVPGILHKLSGIFGKHEIQMTAVDSHDPGWEGKEGIEFQIGDEGTDEQISSALPDFEEAGFEVIEVKPRAIK